MNNAADQSLKQMLATVADDVSREELDVLLNRIANVDVALVEEPSTGLVMMAAKDCFQVPFNLGEVLITTADVLFKGRRFRGMAMGDNPEMAVLLATVDALEVSHAVAPSLTTAIGEIYERVQRSRAMDAQRVASTQVAFNSMKKENVQFGTLGS